LAVSHPFVKSRRKDGAPGEGLVATATEPKSRAGRCAQSLLCAFLFVGDSLFRRNGWSDFPCKEVSNYLFKLRGGFRIWGKIGSQPTSGMKSVPLRPNLFLSTCSWCVNPKSFYEDVPERLKPFDEQSFAKGNPDVI